MPRLVKMFLLLMLLPLAACQNAGPPRTFLIVHGAWGGGWAFRDVDSLLTADGHKVYRPTLTGQGERANLTSPEINLSLHIQDIVDVIRYEDLHNIVLVGHSYGGMVITGVADRLPDRIAKLIYVDALLPRDGESFNDLLPDPIGRLAEDGYIYPTWKVSALPPHDVPMSAKTFAEKISLHNAAATAKIPSVYILTVDAGKTPPQDRYYPFYVRAQANKWPTDILANTDHNAQWSNPKGLVKMLETYTK